MKKYFCLVFLGMSGIFLLAVSPSSAVNVKDTLLLSQPAVSQNHIAFLYAGDLWVANLDGRNVRRLTSDEGIESHPAFSPDGQLIAFSAQYEGNTDVYLVPVEGGVPKRLTWHPGADIVRCFTSDGQSVLFISSRYVANRSSTQLFSVSIQGGFPQPLPLPCVYKASFSPDAQHLAYTPLREAFLQWKNYRGGTVSTIWIYSFADKSVVKIPQPEGRCNDTDPMWIGQKIYFRSDRNGEFNLFSYDLQSQKIEQLTYHQDFPIVNASAGDGQIVYEQAGRLHLYNLEKGTSTALKIGVAADLIELRPRYVKGNRYIRHASLSPSGARAVFEFRGEIITVPAKKGDPRNLTETTAVHERWPAWSPDGQYIAYFSDESGEYELHIKGQDGKGKVRKYKIPGAGFYDSLVWSPDNQKVSFADNSWSLYWLNLSSGQVKKIATEYLYGPRREKSVYSVWSPDSKWIAYTLNTAAYIQKVYLYSLAEDKSYPITDGMSDVSDPVFDASGKYLYFFSSTNAGPVKQWFAMSNADMEMTRSIYLTVLRKGLPSPLAKESDEEKGLKKEEKPKEEQKKSEKPEPFSVDLEGINYRILALPVPAGNYFSLQAGKAGEIYYLEAAYGQRSTYAKGAKLHHFQLKERQDEVIMDGANGYLLSADNKKILYVSKETWGIVNAAGKIKPGQGKIKIEAIEVHIDPQAEWRQIFYEAWRINRDYFYASNMHGVDWAAMRDKYASFLPHLSCRNDLNRVIQWMCSELRIGHHRVGGGDTLIEPRERVPGGLLGADYVIENGRYRFKKIYGGLNWNPDLRSPLTEPGVDVKEGEYLLAVQGKELRPPTNLFSLFENTAGRLIEITVGPNPDGTGSRTVSMEPLRSEASLRNRAWVEGNLKKVEEATRGRVAYVYVPNTAGSGHTYFKRYFFPQVDKEAIIVDERFNGGGLVADYYIDILRRPLVCYWHTRYGHDLKTPGASIQGPKVMLINELAGSGGDLLPWMFRKFKVGKLIGKRTWGGLVGTLGFPILMDGGYVTAPNLAIWTEEGWVVENEGVPPDIEVEQWPDQVMAGHDPQLEKAIAVIMEELKENPPKKVKRPPFPVKVKKDDS